MKLCALRRKLSQQGWLDDSIGCCQPIWYCPFNFPERSELTSHLTPNLTSFYNFPLTSDSEGI